MTEIAPYVEGVPSWRRRALLAALLALAATIAALAVPSRSEAACTVDYCFSVKTTADGTYTLNIAPKFLRFAPAPYGEVLENCVWDIEVDFGDESEIGHYTFDESLGIHESHQFPEYGVYTVKIAARNGYKNYEPKISCPDLDLEGTVTYAEPAPEEPPKEEPPPGNGNGSGVPTGEAQNTSTGPGPANPNSNGKAAYWRRCGGRILTHRVACKRARNVLTEARPSLAEGLRAPVHVSGFVCHLRPDAKRQIACRRGGKRILAPM